MEAFDEEYTPENPTVSEPTLSSFSTLGINDCHATSIKRSEQDWFTPIPKTCPSTRPTCWISIVVWCCLVHLKMGQTLIMRCNVSGAIVITSYCELWQTRNQHPVRIGISSKRDKDTLQYEINTLAFWLRTSTAIVGHFA
jgi:hypothetical protein